MRTGTGVGIEAGTNGRASLAGRTIAGKYRLDEVVGVGAMGVVYRATQEALERTVAIKVLLPELNTDPTFQARFTREARAAGRLEHPNLMSVLDFGTEPDGTSYLVMEFLDGRSLHALLEERIRLEPEHAVRIISQVLAGLAAAHDAGVVHRDLKPENIMLVTRHTEEGVRTEVAKVADFGIASVADARGALVTRSGLVAGTPEYMSPEQGQGMVIDGRSDLYACGVLLYQLVTGTLPFEGDTALAVMVKHLNAKPEAPSRRVNDLPPELEAIILRALEKDRDNRYPDARTMRTALREFARHEHAAHYTGTFSALGHSAPPGPPSGDDFAPTSPLPETAAFALGTAARRVPAPTTTAPSVVSAPQLTPVPAVKSPSRPLLGLAAGAALAVGLGGLWAAHTHRGGETRPPLVAANAPTNTVSTTPVTITSSPAPAPTLAAVAPEVQPSAPAAGATRAPADMDFTSENSRHSRSGSAPRPSPARRPNVAAVMLRPAPNSGSPTTSSSAVTPSADPSSELDGALSASPAGESHGRTPAAAGAHAPAPVAAPSAAEPPSLHATIVRLDAPPSPLRDAIVGRASNAASALARCVTHAATAHGATETFSGESMVRVAVTLRDHRVEMASVRGAHSWIGDCERPVREAFGSALNTVSDEPYTLGFTVALAP